MAATTLDVAGQTYEVFRLPDGSERLPYTLRILLENVLRHGEQADADAISGWQPQAEPSQDISFRPARVLHQDFTGVPAIVDLAAMRNAMQDLGGDPSRINPQLPSELVIDHSVQVDEYASAGARFRNAELEFERNRERYAFLRWGQGAFDNLKVVPPNTGIVHQVNLEFLARVVEARDGREHVSGVRRDVRLLPGRRRDAALPPADRPLRGAGRARRDVLQGERSLARAEPRAGVLAGRGARPLDGGAVARRSAAAAEPRPAARGEGLFPGRAGDLRRRLRQRTGRGNRGVVSRQRSALERGGARRRESGDGRRRRGRDQAGDRAGDDGRPRVRARARVGRDRGDHLLHEHVESAGDGRRRAAGEERRRARARAEAVGEVLARARFQGRDRVLRTGRPAAVPRRARLPDGRLRLHHLHRELGSAAGGDLRGGGSGRPRRLLGALGEPELRGAHPP